MHASHRISTVILAGLFATMSIAGGAWAESQAGGLPAVSDRVSVLEGITANLQTAVTTLRAETTARRAETKTLRTDITTLQATNTTLQNALSAETAARRAADTALQTANTDFQNALDVETFARRAADIVSSNAVATLSSRLDTVTQTGKAYETEVRSTFLVNGALGTLAVLDDLPAGRYFVIAKALVENVDHDAGWTCYLLRGNEAFPNTLDITAATTDSGFIENSSNVTLTAVATLAAPGSFKIQCFTLVASSTLRWVKIVAISAQ